MNKIKEPKIRFENYTDFWKQVKLSDISERIVRKNTNLESTLPLTISAQQGLIDQREYFDKQIASRNLSGYYLVKNGEFAYNKSYSNGYPLGAIKRLDRYKEGVLSTLYIVFKPLDIDSQYLASYYDTNYWHSEVSRHASEGARNHGLLNISPQNFFKTLLFIPKNSKEQIKIGLFFKQLDKTIVLHQQLLNDHKQLKKAMLQKMFPQKGTSVPEIRFDGFNGNWKKINLGKLVEISSGINGNVSLNNGKYKLTRIETISNGMVNFNRVGFTNELPERKYLLNKGDILYSNINSLAHIGKIAKYNLNYELYHGINLLRLSPKNILNSDFLYQYLNTVIAKQWAVAHANQAVNQASINQTELSKQLVYIPNYEEQTKIGDFFKQLDDSITLHGKKLETYQEFKKAMLQKMFV